MNHGEFRQESADRKPRQVWGRRVARPPELAVPNCSINVVCPVSQRPAASVRTCGHARTSSFEQCDFPRCISPPGSTPAPVSLTSRRIFAIGNSVRWSPINRMLCGKTADHLCLRKNVGASWRILVSWKPARQAAFPLNAEAQRGCDAALSYPFSGACVPFAAYICEGLWYRPLK